MTDQNTPLSPLSPRHERFVLEFLKDGNATRAYIRAGFSARGAQPSASRLLRQPHIEAAIAAGRQRVAQALELSVERIGREYAQIAFANIDDYVSVEDDGRLRIDLEKASQAQRAGILELKVSNHSKPEQQVTLKLGKLQALAALTDHIGLFTRKPEPAMPSADRTRYEREIAKLKDELEDAMLSQGDAEDERDDALAALAEAQAKLAAAGLGPSARDGEADEGLPDATSDAIADEAPRSSSSALRAPSPSGPSAAPDLRGTMEDHSNPCGIAAPDEPSPPHRAGAGHGTIFWNTTRQPPSGPTRHEIPHDGAGFPGR
jgi:phage terminase small subunit